jgi:hypothetical protein
MGESGIFYVQFWSLQNLVWGLERTTLTNNGVRKAVKVCTVGEVYYGLR